MNKKERIIHILKVIKNIISRNIYAIFSELKSFSSRHYSLEGEDILLSLKLNNKSGFYIDIGAHHPKYLSNTYLFYKRGWKGINIDAMPGSMNKFNRYRPRDLNLEIPVSDDSVESTYYIFRANALNTFSKDLANEYIKFGHKLIKKVVLKPQKLSDILNKYLRTNQHIDFISLDVEGYDLKVLKSNNWKKYRPDYLLVEDQKFSIDNPTKSNIYNYLNSNNYEILSKLHTSLLFKSKTI